MCDTDIRKSQRREDVTMTILLHLHRPILYFKYFTNFSSSFISFDQSVFFSANVTNNDDILCLMMIIMTFFDSHKVDRSTFSPNKKSKYFFSLIYKSL